MDTAFYSEIKAQPQSMRRVVTAYQAEGYRAIRDAADIIRQSGAVVMTGMGTSYNVCLSALAELGGAVRVNAVQTYQLLQTDCAGLREGDTLIIISQSGESGEAVRLCRQREGKNRIIGITNDAASSLAAASELLLPLYCDVERSITNCTFTASLAVLGLLCAAVRGSDLDKAAADILDGSDLASGLLRRESAVFDLADSMGRSDRIFFIGRSGMELALARQSALTFQEGADCNANCFDVGSFRHGPMELCGPGLFAVFYASDEYSLRVMGELAHTVSAHGGVPITVSAGPALEQGVVVGSDSALAYAMAAALISEMLLVRAAQNRGKEAGIFNISGKICREYQ